jgi:hypothetical protein
VFISVSAISVFYSLMCAAVFCALKNDAGQRKNGGDQGQKKFPVKDSYYL